jgi:hypothetical protein
MGCWAATNNDHFRTDLLYNAGEAAAVSHSHAVVLLQDFSYLQTGLQRA